jgi:hypothetical protein
LSQSEMEKREMNLLKGGCSCAYAGSQTSSSDAFYGGSGTCDNSAANHGY